MPPPKVISISEVETIALQVFEQNFMRLSGDAASIATERANAFTRDLLSTLAREAPAGLDKADDPLFLQSVYASQKHFALTGDADLEAVLIQLLVSLSVSKSRSLREICLSEAIDRAGKITSAQLSILALIFVTTLVRWEAIYRNDDFAKFVSDVIEPFCCAEALDAKNFSHLASLGCLEISGGMPREFEVFLMTHFRTLFSRGIPREELIRSIDGGEAYLPLFEAFEGDPARLRYRFQTNESIEQAAVALGLPGSWRATFQIDARHLMTSPEKLAYIKSLNPAIEKLQQIWNAPKIWNAPNAPLPKSSLTTTGIAIAHSFLASVKKVPGTLAHWL